MVHCRGQFEEEETLENIYEPYLLKLGFVSARRAAVVCNEREHMGISLLPCNWGKYYVVSWLGGCGDKPVSMPKTSHPRS